MITDETLMMDLQQISNISQKYPKVSKSFHKYVKIPNDSKIYKIIKELLWEIGSANTSL